jgi:hypothetical protein
MYLVVVPRVNLIVTLSSYARCFYSIKCPTIICLPSMCYFILWRDTTSELWTLVLFSFILLSPVYFTRVVYFTRILLFFFHSIRSFLCFKQTGEIDNLIVSWEQSIWLCCAQVSNCSWQSKAWTRCLINCPELSQASKHHLQSFGFFSFGSINLGFLLRENLAAIFIIPSSWGSQLDGEH